MPPGGLSTGNIPFKILAPFKIVSLGQTQGIPRSLNRSEIWVFFGILLSFLLFFWGFF